MNRYDATDDPLCYSGTHILKNKAGITDQNALDQFEHLMFLTRSDENLPEGQMDYAHYQAIHHHFFQDVYVWAGETRQIRTAKGGNWFCFPEYIDHQMKIIFNQLADEKHLVKYTELDIFADRASHYISEINAVHPFREGNGRCQLTLLNILFELSAFEMSEEKLNPTGFMTAMVDSFNGDNTPLARAIKAMSD